MIWPSMVPYLISEKKIHFSKCDSHSKKSATVILRQCVVIGKTSETNLKIVKRSSMEGQEREIDTHQPRPQSNPKKARRKVEQAALVTK